MQRVDIVLEDRTFLMLQLRGGGDARKAIREALDAYLGVKRMRSVKEARR
jgi:hypothetical protein